MTDSQAAAKDFSDATFNESELHAALDTGLKHALLRGADSAEAVASVGEGLGVNVRLGELETIEHNRDRGLVITVYFGLKSGSASTSDYRSEAVIAAAEAVDRQLAELGHDLRRHAKPAGSVLYVDHDIVEPAPIDQLRQQPGEDAATRLADHITNEKELHLGGLTWRTRSIGSRGSLSP